MHIELAYYLVEKFQGRLRQQDRLSPFAASFLFIRMKLDQEFFSTQRSCCCL
jgi:hypothetical protein